MGVDVAAKRLGILHSLLPAAERFAALVHPHGTSAESIRNELQTAAATIGREVEIFAASTTDEIDAVFAALGQKRAGALLITPHPIFNTSRAKIVELAARHRIPGMYTSRDFVEIGGLMSYAAKIPDQYYQVGIYTGRILHGEKPSDLPLIRPSRFEFVINLKTARMLDLEIPPSLIAVADALID